MPQILEQSTQKFRFELYSYFVGSLSRTIASTLKAQTADHYPR